VNGKLIELTVNGVQRTLEDRGSLLDTLRGAGYFGVKFGCGSGDCGACTVLLDGQPLHSCQVHAADAAGRAVTTIEGLADGERLHPLQQAFIEAGGLQCGYCTPAQILTAKALLDRNPDPSEAEIRQAMSGVLCRCTGYVKIVQAVQRAAALMRGENGGPPPLPQVITPPEMAPLAVVGQPKPKVDGAKLVTGRPAYTDDIRLDGMLYGALLTSPHAHARIRRINASRARALPGVHAVLTWQDIPRVKYCSGGQSYPQPPPFDQVVLDNKVRHVGDRVAVVAAETPEIARQALALIEVDYEVLEPVLDAEAAMADGAPVIHDEVDTHGIHDAARNIVHHIDVAAGDAAMWERADYIFERTYRTAQQQQAQIEPHVCITWWDADGRLVVRTSTQVPFHVRRILAPLVGLPVRRIRVVKPRIGGGFGGKQELVLEDLCAHLTLATGRPVRMHYSRRQEFTSARSRHPQIMRYKVGVTKDMEVVAMQLDLIGDTGAYGTHGLTVQMVGGQKALSLYNAPYSRFVCDVVYTTKPPPGAFRGYGAVQCFFGLETVMAEIADEMGWDVVEFKRKNWVRQGEELRIAKALGEGREGISWRATCAPTRCCWCWMAWSTSWKGPGCCPPC